MVDLLPLVDFIYVYVTSAQKQQRKDILLTQEDTMVRSYIIRFTTKQPHYRRVTPKKETKLA